MSEMYNSDYYNNGVASGLSCYENYRWIPELTYPLAFSIAEYLQLSKGTSILDYGCAHGFIVKAFKDFGVNSFGVDLSEYAIENCPRDIEPNVCVIDGSRTLAELVNSEFSVATFDYIMAKDVFEHIQPPTLQQILVQMTDLSDKLFVVVPLGDDGVYRVSAYHNDVTHVIAESEDWWTETFNKSGWEVRDFNFKIAGMKENWTEKYPRGNGFFLLSKRQ